MRKRFITIGSAFLTLALFAGALAIVRPWAEGWGATNDERSQTLPGDELLPPQSERTTMAVSIAAPPEQVWPWLAQFGAGRGGLYTYSWFEGLISCPVVNADHILPDLQALRPGDQVRLCPGEFGPPPFTVADVQPDRALILGSRDMEGTPRTSTWQFVLVPAEDGGTRLLLRSGKVTPSLFDTVLGPGFFVMQRRMLQGFQERVEGRIMPWYTRDIELAFWLIGFVVLLAAVIMTATGRQPVRAFVLAVVAVAITLVLVFAAPPVWVDVLGILVIAAGMVWSLRRPAAAASPRIALPN